MRGRASSVGKTGWWIHLGVSLFMMLLVMTVLSAEACASYSAPAETPKWVLEEVAVSYEVPAGPGDEKVVEVKVGEMKVALATAERYEALVEQYNEVVGTFNVVVERARTEEAKVTKNQRVGVWNSWVVGIGAGLGGVLLGFLVGMFSGR